MWLTGCNEERAAGFDVEPIVATPHGELTLDDIAELLVGVRMLGHDRTGFEREQRRRHLVARERPRRDSGDQIDAGWFRPVDRPR